ncbi:MAG TPA: AAA family ATPase [Candidatus Limnocylindrales bacterium]|nr:AAA family ATPase [Candidatus Limnocylindrales bacterium]
MTTSPAADDLGGRSVSITIALPSDALVLLIGVAASGKSTFAARHFAATEVLSSDAMRAMIADDPGAQGATDDAFDLLHRILAMRLRRGRLTVVDATNVEDWARSQLIAVARRHRRPAVAIVLDLPLEVALERNTARVAPRPPPAALRRQHRWLRDSLSALPDEGLAAVHHLRSAAEIDGTRVERAQGRTKRPEGTGVRPR